MHHYGIVCKQKVYIQISFRGHHNCLLEDKRRKGRKKLKAYTVCLTVKDKKVEDPRRDVFKGDPEIMEDPADMVP